MCSVSMVMDHYGQKWGELYPHIVTTPQTQTVVVGPYVTRDELEALRRDVEDLRGLIIRAKQYDREHNQPDCEVADKVALVRKVAELVGIDIVDALDREPHAP